MFNKGLIVHSSKLKHIVVALCLSCMSMPAISAGLGKLNVLSGLGEPLRADIELLSVTPEELSTITAAIASNEAYVNQGIDKPASHNDIKIEVAKNTRGVPVLKLKSTQPITDAFIDMLIQVDWSSGRLLREYTLLLDPPGYNADKAIANSTAELPTTNTNNASSTSVAPPTPVDTLPPMTGEASVSSGVKSAKKSKRDKVKQENALPEMVPSESAQEYTTERGDTLMKIARDMKPEGVSLEQMLVGLYQANPQAFDGKNMNRLKVGQIIKAPSQEDLAGIGSKRAKKQVKVHSANWNAYKNRLAGIVADTKTVENESASQSSSGKVTAAEDKSTPPTTGPKDVVKLSAVDSNKKELNADKALQDKVVSLQEEAIAKDNALKEAQSRTTDLEKQIEDMKKLLALKNDAMAKIQNEAVEQAKAPEVPKESVPAEAVKPEEIKPQAEVKVEPVAPAVPVETAKEMTPPPTEVKKPESAPTPIPAPVTPVDVTVEEPSFFSSLTENLDLNTLGLGAGALGLLGGGWWFFRNKRRKNLASFEEGIMTSGGLKANTVFGNTAGGTVDTGDTSFLTDFSTNANSGMIDSHDVDPIAEAEVYMAYGRDAQAEEILKDAITKEPKRHELHLKLLEIYQTSGNTSAFEAISGELYTSLGATSPVWAKVAVLGLKMDPNNPLYQVSGNTNPITESPKEPAKEASVSKEEFFSSLENSAAFNLPEDISSAISKATADIPDAPETITKAAEVATSDSLEMDIGDLDFSFDTPKVSEPVVAVESFEPSSPVLADLEFKMDKPEQAVNEIKTTVAETSQSEAIEFPSFSMDEEAITEFENKSLDATTLDFPTFDNLDETVSNQASEIDTAFESNKDLTPQLDEVKLDAFLDSDTDDKSLKADISPATNFNFADIDLELKDNPNVQEVSFDLASNESEEVETKLDLVMAYLDMEDKVGAKELLDEVMAEGGESQRKRASELLAKIA